MSDEINEKVEIAIKLKDEKDFKATIEVTKIKIRNNPNDKKLMQILAWVYISGYKFALDEKEGKDAI